MNHNTQEDDSVDDLVAALRNNRKETKELISSPERMERENIESFIMDSSATLVKSAMETLADVQVRVSTAGTASEIAACAELMSAIASSIEILGKLHRQDKELKAKAMMLQMQIDAKAKSMDNNKDGNGFVMMRREDLFKEINKPSVNKSSDKTKNASEINI